MSKRFRMSTALDVDDLLMECIPYAIRLANEKYKFDPPLTIYEVDRWGKLGTRADVIFEFFNDPEFFKNQPVMDGANNKVIPVNLDRSSRSSTKRRIGQNYMVKLIRQT